MTDLQIEVMEAGSQMDALVAEKVMGWTKRPEGRDPERYGAMVYAWYDKNDTRVAWCQDYISAKAWSPSENISEAWEVLNWMRSHRPDLKHSDADGVPLVEIGETVDPKKGWYAGWVLSINYGYGERAEMCLTANAPTAPLAICRAALKLAFRGTVRVLREDKF